MVKEIGRVYMGEVIDIFFSSPRMWGEGKREKGIYIWLITKFDSVQISGSNIDLK